STTKNAATPEHSSEYFTTRDKQGCVNQPYSHSLGPRMFAFPRPETQSRPRPPLWPIQAKLEIGAVDDPLEQEADNIAAEIRRTPEREASDKPTVSPTISGVQRKCTCGATCDDCKAEQPDNEHEHVQRTAAVASHSVHTPSASSAPPIV